MSLSDRKVAFACFCVHAPESEKRWLLAPKIPHFLAFRPRRAIVTIRDTGARPLSQFLASSNAIALVFVPFESHHLPFRLSRLNADLCPRDSQIPVFNLPKQSQWPPSPPLRRPTRSFSSSPSARRTGLSVRSVLSSCCALSSLVSRRPREAGLAHSAPSQRAPDGLSHLPPLFDHPFMCADNCFIKSPLVSSVCSSTSGAPSARLPRPHTRSSQCGGEDGARSREKGDAVMANRSSNSVIP